MGKKEVFDMQDFDKQKGELDRKILATIKAAEETIVAAKKKRRVNARRLLLARSMRKGVRK